MSLSVMLKSPYSLDIREQMEDWVQSLQYLGKVKSVHIKKQCMYPDAKKKFNYFLLSLNIIRKTT